jgi:prevent-host-death family protein
MSAFASLRRLAAVLRAARSEPVIVNRHGKPALVVLAVEEYARLKLVRDDPLGYDTSDPDWMSKMVADALSGKNQIYVDAELAAIRKSLGFPRDPPPRIPGFVETEIDANRRKNKWLK